MDITVLPQDTEDGTPAETQGLAGRPPGTMDTLERFAAGDANAFETLFRRHQGEVYGWIVRLVRNPGVAEELTVETFLRIHRHHARFDFRRPFESWARRIATRAALDYLKSSEYRQSLRPLVEGAACPAEPQDRLLEAETRDQIARAFQSLPARLRVVATLALVEECPYQEIADALDLSVSAVKMRVARAAALLRRSFERMGIRP